MADILLDYEKLLQDDSPYRVTICAEWRETRPQGGPDRVAVVGVLEDDFRFTINNEWESGSLAEAMEEISKAYQAGIELVRRALKSVGLGGIAGALGHLPPTTRTIVAGAAYWTGTAPPNFPLSITFPTLSDPYDDVIVPTQKISQAFLPFLRKEGGKESLFLSPPLGVGFTGAESEPKGPVSLQIGQWFEVLNKLLPNDLEITYSKQMAWSKRKGKAYPLYAKVSMTLQWVTVPTIEHVLKCFKV